MFGKLISRLFGQARTSTIQLPPSESAATTSQSFGDWAESQAKDYLVNCGLTLKDRNYRCKSGEIDLIMTDRKSLVFVEVRSRNNPRYGSALESVTRHKQRRVIKAAQHYLQQKRLVDKVPCRFDVVSVTNGEIQWIPDAFVGNN